MFGYGLCYVVLGSVGCLFEVNLDNCGVVIMLLIFNCVDILLFVLYVVVVGVI